jgi:2-C-methyl-D-erythritol 4-phosphate cytidylyltransferase
MNDFIIITAGGAGNRFKSDIPKQFMEFRGRPILMHTIQRFYDFKNDINIILTLPEVHIQYWKQTCNKYNFTVKHHIVTGGKSRFHSVKNAIHSISNAGLVGVHDGVRPLVSTAAIKNTYETAQLKGNAIASQDIFFSLREIKEFESIAVNRKNYKEIQTPQFFSFEILKDAYNTKYSDDFTDDATVVEKAGIKINLVSGNRENIKITTVHDLKIADALWDSVF